MVEEEEVNPVCYVTVERRRRRMEKGRKGWKGRERIEGVTEEGVGGRL